MGAGPQRKQSPTLVVSARRSFGAERLQDARRGAVLSDQLPLRADESARDTNPENASRSVRTGTTSHPYPSTMAVDGLPYFPELLNEAIAHPKDGTISWWFGPSTPSIRAKFNMPEACVTRTLSVSLETMIISATY